MGRSCVGRAGRYALRRRSRADDLESPMPAARDLILTHGRRVPARLVRARFARSGGKGGQNVNKVETKDDLRLELYALRDNHGTADIRRLPRRPVVG